MARRLIGVDVGGTKVSVAVLEGTTLSEPVLAPTELGSTDAIVDQLVAAIEAAGPSDAVGIGMPSVIDFATGTARFSVNIPVAGVPLRGLLTERLGRPVFIDNDATVAALAEAHDEHLNLVAQSLVMVTVGTGVGGGIVIGGRIYRGATGAAAELGHMIVAADLTHGAPPHEEKFPQPASIEHWAAGRSLDRLGREAGYPSGPEVVAAAKGGDEKAVGVVRVIGERIGVAIANVINLFDPEVVVIGGGVSAAGDLLLLPARESAARFVLTGVGTRTRIDIARQGPKAGVLGAALLAGQEVAA